MAKRKAPRHIGIVMSIFRTAEKLRRENSALRTILRTEGLSDTTIRRRVIACKKVKTEEELSESLLRQCCEEFLNRLAAIDIEGEIASLPEKRPLSRRI
jgi:hypothetical protein